MATVKSTWISVEWVIELETGYYLRADFSGGTRYLDEAKRFSERPSVMIGRAVEVSVTTKIERND